MEIHCNKCHILTATAISAGCHENRSENINKNKINSCLTVHCTRTVETCEEKQQNDI